MTANAVMPARSQVRHGHASRSETFLGVGIHCLPECALINSPRRSPGCFGTWMKQRACRFLAIIVDQTSALISPANTQLYTDIRVTPILNPLTSRIGQRCFLPGLFESLPDRGSLPPRRETETSLRAIRGLGQRLFPIGVISALNAASASESFAIRSQLYRSRALILHIQFAQTQNFRLRRGGWGDSSAVDAFFFGWILFFR